MKRRYFLILCTTMFLLSGCATGLPILNKNQKQYSLNDKSVVFGGGNFSPRENVSYTVFLHDVVTKKEYEFFVAYAALRNCTDFQRRCFVVELPPGDYQISRISFNELSMLGMYNWGCDAKINFSVPEHSLVYIGNFNYSIEQTHNYFFVKTGKGYLWISDDHEKETSRLREVYPNLTDDVKISLMEIQGNQDQNVIKTRF